MNVYPTPSKKRKYSGQGSKTFNKSQTSAIAKIAKKVDLSLAETKSFIGTSSRSGTSDFWYASNLIYPIGQGTLNENIVGEKMYIEKINFRLSWKSSSALPVGLRVAVVKAKQNFTNSHASITATDIIRSPASITPLADHLDNHKLIIKKDITRVAHPNTTSGIFEEFVFSVPIKKTEYFLSDNNGYLQFGNYYLLLMGTDGTGIGSVGTWGFTWTVDFKDM